ncbi:MAG: glycosyltransferase family 4 protein [Candidatus Anstonellales archaeon]
MNNIKVFCYKNTNSPSPHYYSLYSFPPKNIVYMNTITKSGTPNSYITLLKNNIIKAMEYLGLCLPNIRPINKNIEADIIHSFNCLAFHKEKPIIADLEMPRNVILGAPKQYCVSRVKSIVSHKNYKKILTWTDKTKNEILKMLDVKNDLKDKFLTLYPTIPPIKIKQKRNKKKHVLLFTARYFKDKGGMIVLDVFKEMKMKYDDIECIIVSNTPSNYKEYYSKYGIKFFDLMDRHMLFKKIFSISTIYIYPGLSDSYGFTFLEAMSFGLPIVTQEGYARDEMVKNNKEGFVIKNTGKDLINEYVEKIEELINNKKLYNEMSRNCIKTINEGRFCAQKRNEKLRAIYEEAIRK